MTPIEQRLTVIEAVLGIKSQGCLGEPDKCPDDLCSRDCPLQNSVIPIQTDAIRRLAENHLYLTTLVGLMEEEGILPTHIREAAQNRITLDKDRVKLQRLQALVRGLQAQDVSDVVLQAPLARIEELERRMTKVRSQIKEKTHP